MNQRIRGTFGSLVAVAALAATDAAAQTPSATPIRLSNSAVADSATTANTAPSTLSKVDAMVMLDYQVIPVPNDQSIDLMGFHVLNKVSDSVYFGIGAYAPLVKGGYGGFMAFDMMVLAKRKISGNLFGDASFSIGGGGGGKSTQHSIVLSGTGGFAKGTVGLGYDFGDFSVGANVARMKFKNSAIDGTHLNLFVQAPFWYVVGPYANAGSKIVAGGTGTTAEEPSENTLTMGLVKFHQIDPKASYKGSFQLADFQFSHFMTPNAYWYLSLAIGYQGVPLYNQMLGGIGYRLNVTPQLHLNTQLGLGSGGYAPDKIDTAAGLLVYPKVSAEYDIAKNFSLALATGYLWAPKGSSKNYSLGAALNYHKALGTAGTSDDNWFKGFRLSLFQQTEFNVSYLNLERRTINMFTMQLDSLVSPHLYIPLQASIAYVPYLGYPGYGEVLVGAGLQTEYAKDQPVQFFGEVLAGANVHGPILKAGLGANYGLSDKLAIRASAGKTRGPSDGGRNFRTDYLGLGMTYRFSIPGW